MITELSIKNYKCFELQRFELAKLNLLVGMNGAGKSSVIQSMLLLRQSKEQGLLDGAGLALNGDYVQVGSGKDALFEKAVTDLFGFGLRFTSGRQIEWSFRYDPKGDVVTAENVSLGEDVVDESIFGAAFEYLHTERSGPRTHFPTSEFQVRRRRHLGTKGEYAIHFLSHFGRSLKVRSKLLHPAGKSDDLIDQVEAWMGEICPGTRLHFTPYGGMDAINIEYSFVYGVETTERYRATNVGFGITFTLPVLVAVLAASSNALLLIENPEAHLHPKGQVMLGRLLARLSDQDVQMVVETHSDHILNGIRLGIHSGSARPSDVKFHYFRRELNTFRPPTVTTVELDHMGRLKTRPPGFFDEFSVSLDQLLEPPTKYAGPASF